MRILMIRHGMTAGNREKRYIGRTDEPLCEEGIRQVGDLRCLLEEKFGKEALSSAFVAVSPMRRTWQTAQLLFEEKEDASGGCVSGEEPARQRLRRIEDFRECDFGAFENRNYTELSGNPAYQRWIDSGGALPFPGGEDPHAFRERCCLAFAGLMREAEQTEAVSGTDPKERLLCIVVHGGTIMSIAERFAVDECGEHRGYYDWYIGNAQAFVFEVTGSVEDDHFLGRTGCIGL